MAVAYSSYTIGPRSARRVSLSRDYPERFGSTPTLLFFRYFLWAPSEKRSKFFRRGRELCTRFGFDRTGSRTPSPISRAPSVTRHLIPLIITSPHLLCACITSIFASIILCCITVNFLVRNRLNFLPHKIAGRVSMFRGNRAPVRFTPAQLRIRTLKL